MRGSAVCLLRDRVGNWQVYGGEIAATGGDQTGAAWTEGK